MGTIFRFLLLAAAAAFLAMFFEPFFSRLLLRIGIDTSTWVDPMLNYFEMHTWLQFLGAGVIGAAIGTWLHWGISRFSRKEPPQDLNQADSTQHQSIEPDDGYTDAHEKLLQFVTHHLMPTCYSQLHLQEAIIDRTCGRPKLAEKAKRGLLYPYEWSEFYSAYKNLSGLGHSPPTILTACELVECVAAIERGYARFVGQSDELAKDAEIKLQTDLNFAAHYESWRERHNAMCDAYEEIKSIRSLKPLYRPLRPSRWGGHVFRVVPSEGYSPPQPQDTE